jgi:hypothetical protein
VLPAQQVVSKVQAAQHIKRNSGDADSRDCVVVHQRQYQIPEIRAKFNCLALKSPPNDESHLVGPVSFSLRQS